MEIVKLVNDNKKKLSNTSDGKGSDINDSSTTYKTKKKDKNTNLEITGNANLVKDEYYCEICEYRCERKYNFQMHLNSNKHQTKATQNAVNNSINKTKLYCCNNCNKDFINNSGLWKHKKKCITSDVEPDKIKEEPPNITTDVILEFIKQNKELQNVFIQKTSELQNTIIEQNKQIVELSKNQTITNNTTNNNTNNTTNQQFNLQFFLNETCKDAMNITDFVNSLQLTTEDFENTGKLGFIEGITRIIVKKLNSVDTSKRPVHCTDAKRETLYIKDDNVWEKEDDKKTKFRKVVNQVANKNLQQLNKWKDEHPDCIHLDTPENIDFRKYYRVALGGVSNEEDEKFFEKIKRNVLKEIVVNKSI
jgi:Zinc-finger of C2H2 type